MSIRFPRRHSLFAVYRNFEKSAIFIARFSVEFSIGIWGDLVDRGHRSPGLRVRLCPHCVPKIFRRTASLRRVTDAFPSTSHTSLLPFGKRFPKFTNFRQPPTYNNPPDPLPSKIQKGKRLRDSTSSLGPWTSDLGPCTLDLGLWTLGARLWTLPSFPKGSTGNKSQLSAYKELSCFPRRHFPSKNQKREALPRYRFKT